jgi:hypothetical protein
MHAPWVNTHQFHQILLGPARNRHDGGGSKEQPLKLFSEFPMVWKQRWQPQRDEIIDDRHDLPS